MNLKLIVSLIVGLLGGAFLLDVPVDCLLLSIPFDEEVQDEHIFEYPVRPMGGIHTLDREGESKKAYLFDGVDDHLVVNNNEAVIEGRGEFTISVWVKTLGKGGGFRASNPIFVQRDDESLANATKSLVGLFADYNDGGKIVFMMRGSRPQTGYVTTVDYPAFEYGEWHHYAATFDSTSIMKLYLDGELVRQKALLDPGDLNTSTDYVEIGRHSFEGLPQSHLNGAIDDFKLFDCALNDEAIKKIFEGDEVTTNTEEVFQWEEKTLVKLNSTITGGHFQLEKVAEGEVDVSLFDLNGRLLLNKRMFDEQETFDIGHLPAAPYFIQIRKANGLEMQSLKVVKVAQ